MTSTALPKKKFSWSLQHRLRKFTAYASVTLFGLIVLLAFLTPLLYMGVTAFKTKQQVIDPNSQFLPSTARSYTYNGTKYDIYQVPTEDGVKAWALVVKGREKSSFIDPANPDAGLIEWVGRWRTLKPDYEFDPATDNFAKAWNATNFGRIFMNTFIIATLGVLGTLLSSVCVAYGFSRFRIPGVNAIFMVLMATIILPGQVTLIPTYIFFRQVFGGNPGWWPLILPHFFANAYNVFLLRQYFKGIPKDLDEAAMIDGASPLRILTSVIIPQSWPALTAVAMFHFFWSWNDFFNPLIYLQGKEELYTISVALMHFNNIYAIEPGLLMAGAMMAVALPVVIFFIAQKVFMQGIVITGVEK